MDEFAFSMKPLWGFALTAISAMMAALPDPAARVTGIGLAVIAGSVTVLLVIEEIMAEVALR